MFSGKESALRLEVKKYEVRNGRYEVGSGKYEMKYFVPLTSHFVLINISNYYSAE
jgi:hypothetical protein